MSKIKILNNSLKEQGTIQSVLSSSKTEVINSEKTLRFSAFLKGIKHLITGDNIAEVDDDYFDIIEYKKGQSNTGKMTVDVDCEHISYRLNDPDYNLEYFTWIGTPKFILGKILEGTGFVVGTVEFTEVLTYSAQEAKSRRQILMEFIALLGGEVDFNKFTVNILLQRGSSIPKDLLIDRNIEVLSKTYSKREKDSNGNPLVSYSCALIKPKEIALGDVVTIDYESLDINVELRVISITTDPYNKYLAAFEIGNFYPGLADDAYRIETSTLIKSKIYYGSRISPEHGFESIRSDKKARTVMNADTFAMQAGDGQGNWINKIYFDPATGKYIFDGELSVNVKEDLGSVATFYQTETPIDPDIGDIWYKPEVDYIINNLNIPLNELNIPIEDLVSTQSELKRWNGAEWKLIKDSEIVRNVANLTVRADEIGLRVESTEGNIGELQLTAISLTTRITDAEGNVSTLQQTSSSLTTRITDAEGNISTLEQTATSLTTRITDAEGNISIVTQTANSLTSRLTTAEGNISTVTQTANSLSSRLTTAEGNISTVTQTANSLTTRISDAEGNISTITQTTSGITAAVNNSKLTFDTTGLTIKNGGFKIMYGSSESLSIRSTGGISMSNGLECKNPSLGTVLLVEPGLMSVSILGTRVKWGFVSGIKCLIEY